MSHDLDEANTSLWALAVPPLIWAAHFLLSYTTAAVWCAKYAGPERTLAPARIAIGIYSALALAALTVTAVRGYRRQRVADLREPHDRDTPEDRYRFVGYAAMLLSGLSGIAIVYAALVAVITRSCH